ncbi:hypothetical protein YASMINEVIRUS_247 [Yasminevirus sp. GU-2018]|uniref:Uncharacterized protein n=1 Tax=Yasminevirus sp. GU-2018 TaxID=2420051 RepID=A0A5K0U8H1_9VIRU|nr:hypothetical protein YASMINEVIRUS_247 [Yasminevirus sp. GU-2018]
MSDSLHKKHKKGIKQPSSTGGTYNKKDLHIDHRNTMIIIDWDDTLYPTSWTMENGIDLTDPKSRYRYLKHFENLDDHLSSALEHMITLGDVVIITNAMPEWVELSMSVLPKTKRCIRFIDIISARERYQNKAKMSEWKKYTFVEEMVRRSQAKRYTNILSLGDAEFEYNALVNLYRLKAIPHKYLKAIKFLKTTDYEILLEQLRMIRSNIREICGMTRHMDLTFDTQ